MNFTKFSYTCAILSLLLSGCQSNSSQELLIADIQDSWQVEYIQKRPVIDHSPTRFTFHQDGRITGNAGCNQFAASYTYKQGRLQLSPVGATRMFCESEALNEQEMRFLQALEQSKNLYIEEDLLHIIDAAGDLLIKASRQENAS